MFAEFLDDDAVILLYGQLNEQLLIFEHCFNKFELLASRKSHFLSMIWNHWFLQRFTIWRILENGRTMIAWTPQMKTAHSIKEFLCKPWIAVNYGEFVEFHAASGEGKVFQMEILEWRSNLSHQRPISGLLTRVSAWLLVKYVNERSIRGKLTWWASS